MKRSERRSKGIDDVCNDVKNLLQDGWTDIVKQLGNSREVLTLSLGLVCDSLNMPILTINHKLVSLSK